MRKIVIWGAAALVVAVLGVMSLVLVIWPLPVTMRPVAEFETETVPIQMQAAVVASTGRQSGVFHLAASLLLSNVDSTSMSEWRLDHLVLELRLRAIHNEERVAAWVAWNAYFGAGLTGADDAARWYFCKALRELTVAESAALAALTVAPSLYSSDFEGHLARRNTIIERMQTNGDLAADVAKVALSSPLGRCDR